MSRGIEYLGKKSKRCDCCREYRMSAKFFSWVSILTDDSLGEICFKCARKELFGTKYKTERYEKWIKKFPKK